MNNLTVGLGADISGLLAGLSQASSQLSSFVSTANSRLESFGNGIQGIGTKLLGLSIPLGLLGKQAIENGASLEGLKLGLKSIEEQQYGVGKSAEYATARYNQFVEDGKRPGVGLQSLVAGSIGLRSVGFSADEARRDLLAFGNTLALVGKGKNELNGVNLQLQQLAGKTSGYGADLRVIKEYAPQVGQALLKAFGTIDTEAIAKSGVTGKQVIEKVVEELEKLPKAGTGIKNAMDNLGDSIFISTGRLGEALNKALGISDIFDKIGGAVTDLVTKFEGLSPEVQKFIGITAGLVVIVPPVLIGIGAISTALSGLGGVMLVGSGIIKSFVATSILGMSEFVAAVTISFAEATTAFEFFSGVLLLNPIGATIAGIALLGGAMYGLSRIIGSTTKEVTALQYAEQQLNEVKKANYGTFETEISKTTALVSIINSNVRSLEEKQSALNQLISISPKYFEGLTIEKIRAGEADEAIKKYTKSIYENAVTKGAETKISKLAEQLVSEKDAYDEANKNLQNYLTERKRLGSKETEQTLRSDAKGGIFTKFQFSSDLVNGLDEAKNKISQTEAALNKLSEFVAGRTLKVEGDLPKTTPPTKPLTDEEKSAREKAQKDTEDLLLKLAKFKADLLTNETEKLIANEVIKFEEEKKSIERSKASRKAKLDTIFALEQSHLQAVVEINENARKKQEEFVANSLLNQFEKERALEKIAHDERLKFISINISDKKAQHVAIQAEEIKHYAIMQAIQQKEYKEEGFAPKNTNRVGRPTQLASFNFTALKGLTEPLSAIEQAEKRFKTTIDGFQTQSNRLNLLWNSLGNRLKPSGGLLKAVMLDSQQTLAQTTLNMGKILDNGAKSLAVGFGKTIGAMAAGKAGMADIGNVLLSGFGDILTQLGEQLIASAALFALGAAALAKPLTPAGAAGALAAGIGLVALGSYLSSSTSLGSNSSSGSGSYGGGNNFNGGGGQKLNVQIDIGGEFRMRRNELVAGIQQTQKFNTRTYGE